MSRFMSCLLFVLLAACGDVCLGQESKASQRKGPLAELPSAPGAHLDKVKALADDGWVNLGAPAADAQWGRALGRSWSPKMAFAPDLCGAFLSGEGTHGWVNPKTKRQMDDFWFYDINGHRWVCVYPGTKVENMDANYTLDPNGFTATKDGELVPMALLVHAYEMLTYDTDLKRFTFVGHGCLYGKGAEWAHAKKYKVAGSPWYFDPRAGVWGRQPTTGPYINHGSYTDLFIYVPSKRQSFYHAIGSSRHHSYFYDAATNQWSEVKTNWTEGRPAPAGRSPFDGGNVTACHDSKRDRIYIGFGRALAYFDVKTSTWVLPKATGDFDLRSGHDATMNYDTANDRVVVITLGKSGKVHVYDPDANTFTTTPTPVPKEIRQLNGFYDPTTNAHFVHAATDNNEGVMWAYRYKSGKAK